MPLRINHLAVWVAAIAYWIFGSIWYGFIFGGAWLSLIGKTVPSATVTTYIVSFILGLILAYATAVALSRRPEDLTVQQGISFALFMGIALYATQTLNQALYESRPIALWLIDAGYVVIGFAIIGAIVGGWKPRRAAVTPPTTTTTMP
ncbi:MAG: DUF1761 domain-containing protein [Candidatus Eremiobacteraeota bacterium]|nr:DUF1761 domain-containing protein [Candidatus Eremiobacteraeota bacterium]MBV9648477.1 DUF1761 domain-containing protein [Candidatus Eremiobacteraeota bacterium]